MLTRSLSLRLLGCMSWAGVSVVSVGVSVTPCHYSPPAWASPLFTIVATTEPE
jgi:hypothetical protein